MTPDGAVFDAYLTSIWVLVHLSLPTLWLCWGMGCDVWICEVWVGLGGSSRMGVPRVVLYIMSPYIEDLVVRFLMK